MADWNNESFRRLVKEIILASINAKWIHPSLALRLLKANLGSLEASCEIVEFALRQPLDEKIKPLLDRNIRILGISVSIWNHLAVIELLDELEKARQESSFYDPHISERRPFVVLGGPEVTHLPSDAKIFRYADYVIRGEGENAFRFLCEKILKENIQETEQREKPQFIIAEDINVNEIKSAYHLYTDEDLAKKLIYVEASRGCVFRCEFCLSSVKAENNENKTRDFELDKFFLEMDALLRRGVRTFKFLDRSFNSNIKRALQIAGFFLERIENNSPPPCISGAAVSRTTEGIPGNIVVHFEMFPSLFPPELREMLRRFPPGTLRIETGIQTLNPETAACIGRISNPEKELETLRFLREKTNAVIHADLIAGLPGEDIISFGRGFDRLWAALSCEGLPLGRIEIQLGILKLLPGAPISRQKSAFGMRYSVLPPYEIEETSAISAFDLKRIKNFARFWELIVNRNLVPQANFFKTNSIFDDFLKLSDFLFDRFGKNWGISRDELLKALF